MPDPNAAPPAGPGGEPITPESQFLRALLADRPEVGTAGALAALLAQLPPDTPVTVDPDVLADPLLSDTGEDWRSALLAEPVRWTPRPWVRSLDDEGNLAPGEPVPAVRLGLRHVPATPAPLPTVWSPTTLHRQLADAIDRKATADVLAVIGQQLHSAASAVEVALGLHLEGGTTHPALAALVPRLDDLGTTLTTHAELAHHLARDDVDDLHPGLHRVLVPWEEALTRALAEARELLVDVTQLADVEEDDADDVDRDLYHLPPLLADGRAFAALDRLSRSLRPHLPDVDAVGAEPDRRLCLPDGRRTVPLHPVAVRPEDVGTVAEALAACREALAHHSHSDPQLADLAAVLDTITVTRHPELDGPDPWPQAVREATIAPLARVVDVLQIERDEHHATLVDALLGRVADVRLTEAQHRAFRRVAGRLTAALFPEHPHLELLRYL